VYCGYLKDKRQIRHSKSSSHGFGAGISLLSGLLTEVDSSTDLSTVDEVGQLSSIEASFIPNEDLTSGRIEVGDEKSEIHNCEKVDFVPSTSNADSFVRFVVGNNYGSFSSDEEFDVDWIWSHVSDVRTDNDDSVILTVETPVGKAVFPYDLTHDTDAMFWELVEESGGSLTDLRGMDVFIRERWWLSKEFRRKDLRHAGYISHEYPGYDKESSQQPIQKPNDEHKPTMIDDPTDVRPRSFIAPLTSPLGFFCSSPSFQIDPVIDRPLECFELILDSITV